MPEIQQHDQDETAGRQSVLTTPLCQRARRFQPDFPERSQFLRIYKFTTLGIECKSLNLVDFTGYLTPDFVRGFPNLNKGLMRLQLSATCSPGRVSPYLVPRPPLPPPGEQAAPKLIAS